MPRKARRESMEQIKSAVPLGESDFSSIPPAFSLNEQIDRLIALTYKDYEKRILEGTATYQERIYFLKLGSQIENARLELLKTRTALQQAQIEAIKNADEIKELYENAMNALSEYRGIYNEQ